MVNKLYKISLIPYYCRGDTPALYTILPEKQAAVGGAMMGSSHVYDISAVSITVQIIIIIFLIFYIKGVPGSATLRKVTTPLVN